MASTFDEILISTSYSSDAEGGPEFATVIIRAGDGGSVAYRNSNREDFISRYSIEYGLLSPIKRKELRQFAILREGMARGFRFLAPDDHELIDDFVGVLNNDVISPIFNTDGVTSDFYLIQYMSDTSNVHTRRIVKPSPYEEFTVSFYDAANPADLITEAIFAAGEGLGPYGTIVETISTLAAVGTMVVTLNLHQGKINISPAPEPGLLIKTSGFYHVPVAFSQDWQKFSIDEQGISGFKIGLEEILPVELGII